MSADDPASGVPPGGPGRERLAVTVIGAGAAGLALAARAASRGHEVTVANRPGPRIDEVAGRALGPGRASVRAELAVDEPGGARRAVSVTVTCDIAAAVRDAAVVVAAIASSAQPAMLAEAGDALRPGLPVLLVPGHCGGAWSVAAALRAGGHAVPHLGELPLPFVCRAAGPAQVAILQDKAEVHLGAGHLDLPAVRDAAARLGFPVTHECGLLEAALRNTTAVLQPLLLLANLTRVDRAEPFTIYRQGVGPAVARMAAAVDAERLAIAEAFGLAVPSLADWLRRTYGATGDALHRLIAAVPGYAGIAAPTEVRHRFLVEHVETGVIPLTALGRLAGVPTPKATAVVELASAATGLPLWDSGRVLREMPLPEPGRKPGPEPARPPETTTVR